MKIIRRVRSALFSPKILFNLILGLILEISMIPIAFFRILLSPSGTIWVCFDYDNGTYSDFFRNIYNQFLQSEKSNYKLALLTNLFYPVWSLDGKYKYYHFTPTFLYPLLGRKVVFHATQLRERFRLRDPRAKHIQICHGFASFEAVLDKKYVENVAMFIANTEFQYLQLSEGSYRNWIPKPWIKKDGYPKLDGYVQSLKIGSEKIETIFFGPTYHRDISSIFDYLELIVGFCKENRIHLIVKLHPLLYMKFDEEKSGGIDWVKRLNYLRETEYGSIEILERNLSFDEVYKFFIRSNLFLTDNSGLGYEFVLLTGRPIAFLGDKLKIPLEDLKSGNVERYKSFPENLYRGKIGPIVMVDDFNEMLQDLVKTNGSKYQHEIDLFRQSFTFNLGCSSPFIYKSTLDLVDSWKV